MYLSRCAPEFRGPIRTRFILWLLTALGLIVLDGCAAGDDASPTPVATGTLFGKVSVGPLCPVEPCTNPIDPFAGVTLVITDDGALIRAVEIGDDGSYSATVPAGEYQVNLQPCDWLGCQHALPQLIVTQPEQVLTLDIDIDTGIR